MSIPLLQAEQRFNCAFAGFELTRKREALYEKEPQTGTFVVWRVLGFGGRPNPLVFSRAASFACRCAQGLLGPELRDGRLDWDDVAYGRLQLYVDDPALTLRGRADQINTAMDIVIMFWLALGIPLSWKKGEVFEAEVPHRWIGILYDFVPEGARMRLPPDFVTELRALIDPLCSMSGSVAFQELDAIIGKAARVAHVVPAAKPFVAGLWGALSGARKAAASGQREAPPGRAPTRRFCFAAAWIRALLMESPDFPFPLERTVTPRPPPSALTSGWWIEFDASPFGGGAVLRSPAGDVDRYFSVIWDGTEAEHLEVKIHDPAFQTFWEFSTLLLSR